MNKTVYAVFHIYEVDGGFGDAVGSITILMCTAFRMTVLRAGSW